MGDIFEAEVYRANPEAAYSYYDRPMKVGIARSSVDLSALVDNIGSDEWGYSEEGRFLHDGASSIPIQPWGFAGDIIQVAVNFTLGYMWIGINGVWMGNGDPETDTNPTFTGITGEVFPYLNIREMLQVIGRFQDGDFQHTKPIGYSQWATEL